MYIKDLRIINRSITDILIVDNNIYSYVFNIGNGIPIKSFTDDLND